MNFKDFGSESGWCAYHENLSKHVLLTSAFCRLPFPGLISAANKETDKFGEQYGI